MVFLDEDFEFDHDEFFLCDVAVCDQIGVLEQVCFDFERESARVVLDFF